MSKEEGGRSQEDVPGKKEGPTPYSLLHPPSFARPWWHQKWQLIVPGYLLAFFSGVGFAKWLISWGDWHDGLAWERDFLRMVNIALPFWIDAGLYVMPWLGTNITLLPITVVTCAWLVLRKRRIHEAIYLGIVQIGSNTLNPLVKFMYSRDRPSIIPRRGWYDWAAYPSGHAIASVAVLITLAIVLYRVKGWRWPGCVIAPLLVVSLYSRVYLGVHWPTDVIGGVLIGFVWLAFTYEAFKQDADKKE
jgi:membrane-associated phospholipid phosphatase